MWSLFCIVQNTKKNNRAFSNFCCERSNNQTSTVKTKHICPPVCKVNWYSHRYLEIQMTPTFQNSVSNPPQQPLPCECGNVHACRNDVLVKYALWTNNYDPVLNIWLISWCLKTTFLVCLVIGQISLFASDWINASYGHILPERHPWNGLKYCILSTKEDKMMIKWKILLYCL